MQQRLYLRRSGGASGLKIGMNLAAAAGLLVFATNAQQSSAPPISTTANPGLYLFVDDHWIADKIGIERVVNQAQPLEHAIITPDGPATQMECAMNG